MTEAIQAIVDGVFGGSRAAYNAALAKAGANTFVARAAVADELLRAQIEGALQVPAPTDPQIRLFYGAYASVLIRPFKVAPAAPWLGNRRAGFALAASAPAALFRLPSAVASPFTTGLGSFTVTPTDEALPLGAVPLEAARPAIRTTLLSFARTQAYEDAARKRAESALTGRPACATICRTRRSSRSRRTCRSSRSAPRNPPTRPEDGGRRLRSDPTPVRSNPHAGKATGQTEA